MKTMFTIVAAVSAGTGAAQVAFTPLGFIPGGFALSESAAISADGGTAVGDGRGSSVEAFRWTTSGGMQGLGTLGGSQSRALGVSGDGSVVVGNSNPVSGVEAFRWTTSGGMQGLGFLPGGFTSGARAVSEDGEVIVGDGTSSNSNVDAFRWTASGGMQSLGDLPGGSYFSAAEAVNSDGSVIVGGSNSGSTEAFRWTEAGGMVGLGVLPGGTSSSARGVSGDGTIVAGASSDANGDTLAFRWTAAGGMQSLGELPGGTVFSEALAISSDGTTIVGRSNGASSTEAFIWTEQDGMRSLSTVLADAGLDLTGWELFNATGVSADGTTFTGTGRNPNGDIEAWVATIPAPSTAALLGVAGLAATRRRR